MRRKESEAAGRAQPRGQAWSGWAPRVAHIIIVIYILLKLFIDYTINIKLMFIEL